MIENSCNDAEDLDGLQVLGKTTWIYSVMKAQIDHWCSAKADDNDVRIESCHPVLNFVPQLFRHFEIALCYSSLAGLLGLSYKRSDPGGHK